MPKIKKDKKVELFLDNIERLWPNEIACCYGVCLDKNGNVCVSQNLGALMGGTVLIAVVLDLASSAAKGLKWNEPSGKKHSDAMKEVVRDYLPKSYQSINWYTQFRSPLVHNFKAKNIELTHLEEFRHKHLKLVSVKGKKVKCVHIFALFEDVIRGLRNLASDARKDAELYRNIKIFIGNYGVLEPRDPDC